MLEGVVDEHAPSLEALQERDTLVLGRRRGVVEGLSPTEDGERAKDAVPAFPFGSTPPFSFLYCRCCLEEGTHSMRASEMTAASLPIRSAMSRRDLVARCLERRMYMMTCAESAATRGSAESSEGEGTGAQA